MEIDLEIGDVILTGKFKNKRKIVKDIGKDDLGQPTVNGAKALNFRIEKLMPKDKWSKESKEALEFAKDVNEMKITKRQLRRLIRETIYDKMSYDLGLSTEEGLRTPLAKLLATIAKNEPDGWKARNDDEKWQLAHLRDKGLVTYGLDPRGDYRAHVTDGGLQSLQNI